MADPSIFPATRWTLLRSLREGSEAESKDALEILCRAYWTPLYLVARSRGMSQHDAEDAVQGFFHRVLRNQVLERADQNLGMLRTFLLAAFENYRKVLWKAGRKKIPNSIELGDPEAVLSAEERYQELADGQATPEMLYLREWARLTLERSLDKLREEQIAKGHGLRFDALAPHLIQEEEGRQLQQTAARLGMSFLACRQLLFRLRRAFRDKIEAELALTLGTTDPEQIRREVQELFLAFE